MPTIKFYDEHFAMQKWECGVYKMIINEQWFYYGSSVDLKRRLSSWKHHILKGTPKNANVKFLIPVIETVRFEIIERVESDIDPKTREDEYIKQHLDNFDCLNMCPGAFNPAGRQKAFGQSVRWKPRGKTFCAQKVAQFTKDGEYIKTYDSLTQAAILVTGDRKNCADVSAVAKGNSKWFRGFLFKYVDNSGNFIEPPKFQRKIPTVKPYDSINKPRVTSPQFYQKNALGEIVKVWSNYELAAKSVSVSRGAIYKYLNKTPHLLHRGYFWQYV